MNMKPICSAFVYVVGSGLLATLAMDTAALALMVSHFGNSAPYRIVPNLLGRWIGSMANGTFVHPTILETPALRHEAALGLCCHYLIGITLSAIILYPHFKVRRAPPSLRAAIMFGVGTCVFPYFLMFPAMGFGMLGLKAPEAFVRIVFSAVNHAAFGVGIFLWSSILGTLLAERIGFEEWKSRQAVVPQVSPG